MCIRSIVWAGIRTRRSASLRAAVARVLHLDRHEVPQSAVFRDSSTDGARSGRSPRSRDRIDASALARVVYLVIAQWSARSGCAGITFRSNSSKPTGKLPLYLKKCGGVERATGWWSWSKPKTGPGAPMPAPKMLKACVLFCAAGESCDACHPDDDGYDVLATQVFNWIVANRSAR